jgi:hypothetical protein
MLSAQAAPISYGGHYYDYVNFAVAVTWDQAKTQAEGLSYSGLGGHLATFTSQAEFDAVKSVMDYNTWSMAWVGARDSGSGFTWVQGEGAVNFGAWGSWAAGEPGAGEYGMTLWGPSYGYTFGAEAVGSTGIGQMMVEYDVVPEPTGMALLALGCAAAALRRRVSKKA